MKSHLVKMMRSLAVVPILALGTTLGHATDVAGNKAETVLTITSAAPKIDQVLATCDNGFELYVNGQFCLSGNSWSQRYQAANVPLVKGKNVLAIKATNVGGPGGLIAEFTIGGMRIGTDAGWKGAKSVANDTDWKSASFDDSAWGVPMVSAGRYGGGPLYGWGNVLQVADASPARWIWLNDASGFVTLYFRYTLYVNDTAPVPPVISPDRSPVYTNPVTLGFSSATAGAAIHYTLDGSAPTASSPTFDAAAPPVISKDTTVRAIALKGTVSSEITEARYQVIVAPPVISPDATPLYRDPVTLGFSSATAGAAIHYTLDGSAPTASSPTFDAAVKGGRKVRQVPVEK